MRAANAEDIQRIALARGAQAVIAGRTFNAGKQTVASQPSAKPLPAAPPPIAPLAAPTLTIAAVDRLIAERMSQLGGQLQQALTAQCNSMTLAVASALHQIKPEAGKVAVEHKVKVKYDNYDRITDMTITPVYKKD